MANELACLILKGRAFHTTGTGHMCKRVITSGLVFADWNFHKESVTACAKRTRGRIQVKNIREIDRGGSGDCFVTTLHSLLKTYSGSVLCSYSISCLSFSDYLTVRARTGSRGLQIKIHEVV